MTAALDMTDYFLGAENVLSPSNATAAIIALPGKRYLMQLRDQKPNIFYPGHWGVFGGAIDPGETTSAGLYRELEEELSLTDIEFTPFTSIAIDFSYCGLGNIVRHYFVAVIDDSMLERLRLGEGREMRVFLASELLSMQRVVPYDSFAIWMHATKDDVRFSKPIR
jgi:8-oxo-dGTP pyrophosphatase MutT (NUDIX family)